MEITPAAVKDEVEPEERLEAATEPGPRFADALGNGTKSTVLARVKVEDAVGLAIPDRPEHHCFCLEGSRHVQPVNDVAGPDAH